MGRTIPRHRNVYTHLTAAIVIPGCLVLCWWQVTRALSGNTLSWAYVFEWPIFAGYGAFMWWKLIHDPRPGSEPGTGGSRPPSVTSDKEPPGGPGQAGSHSLDGDAEAETPSGADGDAQDESTQDEELASYNRYLAALNASGKRKRW